METLFVIALLGAGSWYCYRYLKSDFESSIKQNPVDKPQLKPVEATKKQTAPAQKKATQVNQAKTIKAADKPDDLKRLDGIGPKIATILTGQGIQTYAQLAQLNDEKLTLIMQKEGVRIRKNDPSYWKKQADLAASGKWDDVKMLQQKHKNQRTGNVAKAA